MRILRLAFAFALAIAPTLADAQQFPTIPSDTVIGRTQIGSGPAQAIPFSQLIALMLQQSSLNIPTINTNSIIFKGSTSGQATLQAQAVAGTPTLQLPNTSGTIPSTATSPIVLDPASGNISCPTCATSTGAANPVVVSRATAQTLNLSGASAIQTLGYAAGGDGGGAVFKNVGTSPFLDSFVTAGSITAAGSGYTNGTYTSVFFSGGTGFNFTANVVVSGGVVSSVTIINAGGNGYSVGDVLTASNSSLGGTGSGFAWTVSAVSTPKASFTDAVGTHFQYVVDAGNFINPRAFGAKFNFNPSSGDAGATDDSGAIQAAINFASYANPNSQNFTTGVLASGIVQLPGGSALLCSPITVVGSVILRGQGPQNSTLKFCNSGIPTTANLVNLCDPNAHIACFGVQIADLNINGGTGTASNSTYAVYSNAAQQDRVISNVSIYSGNRGCFRYDTGWGGAAMATFYDIFCTPATTALSDSIVVNGGTTIFKFFNTIIETGGAGSGNNGFNLVGGQITIDGLHSEGFAVPVNINMTTSSWSATLMHATGGFNCTALVQLQATNSPGNFALYDAVKNGCTNLVVDGQSGGTNRSADARPSAGWVTFNP